MPSPTASSRAAPAVAHVRAVPVRSHPYRLPPLERLRVLYHTVTRVRLQTASGIRCLRHPAQVIATPEDAAWTALERTYTTYQARLDALATTLRSLGSYPQALAAAGPSAPNPLCALGIEIADPDGYYAPTLTLATPVPDLTRTPILRHTPKMWEAPGRYGLRSQQNLFVCPDEPAWAQVQAAHTTAAAETRAWHQWMEQLGTYAATAAHPPSVPAPGRPTLAPTLLAPAGVWWQSRTAGLSRMFL